MGILGFLALVAATFGTNRRQFCWWPCLAWLSLLLSMGHFGLAWLIQQTGAIPNVDSALGGPYWVLYTLLPFYDSYRYPTKWLPFFAIACAIVAALWMQAASKAPRQSLIRAIKITSIALLLMMITVVVIQATSWNHQSATQCSDEYWGPLQYHAGLRQVTRSILQSATVLLVVSCLLTGWPKRIQQRGHLRWLLLLFIVTIELTWCNVSLVAKADRALEQTLLSDSEITVSDIDVMSPDSRAMRMQTAGGWPDAWSTTSRSNRIDTIAVAERAACFGRWHLDHHVSVFNGMASIRSQDLDTFWRDAANLTHEKSAAQQEHFWRCIQRWLQIDTVIHVNGGQPVRRRRHELPRVTWRKTDREVSPTTTRRATAYSSSQKTDERFAQLLKSIVATDATHSPYAFLSGNEAGKTELEIIDIPVADSLSIAADRASLVVRPVFQDGNWTATLVDDVGTRTAQSDVCNVDFLKQGVVVPAGKWTLTFTYRPWWLTPAIIVALLAWSLLLFVLIPSNLKAMVHAAGRSSGQAPDQATIAS